MEVMIKNSDVIRNEVTHKIYYTVHQPHPSVCYTDQSHEIADSARHLKSGKAAGVDGIVNEILKAGMS